jgi:peptidyl-prolyl cis-trans isomerase D
VSRDAGQSVQGPLLDAALRADPSKLPQLVGVNLGNEGYAIVNVTKVLPRKPAPDAIAQQERKQYAQWLASAESLAYYASLKERFKVQIKVPEPKNSAAAAPQ